MPNLSALLRFFFESLALACIFPRLTGQNICNALLRNLTDITTDRHGGLATINTPTIWGYVYNTKIATPLIDLTVEQSNSFPYGVL